MPQPTTSTSASPLPSKLAFYLPFFLAVLCLATVFPGLFLSFEDSEIWGITSSRRIIDHPLVGSSAHYKPLFSVLFGFIAAVAKSDWSALIASRWLAISFAAGGLFSLYSLGLTFMRSDRRRSVTVVVYAIICTMPLVLVHFSKARSDAVSASLILISGFLLMQFEFKSTLKRGLIYVIGSALAVLVTPKSIDLVMCLGVLFWITDYSHPPGDIDRTPSIPKSNTFTRIVWLIGPVLGLLIIALVISSAFIVQSFVYWLDSYKGINMATVYPWVSFQRAALTAPVPSAVILGGTFVGLFGFNRLNMREKALVCVGLITFTFIAIHSQKYFFFLASRVPFLALGALPGIHLATEYISEKFRIRQIYIFSAFVFLFFLSLGLTTRRLIHYPSFHLADQKAIYQSLEKYLERAQIHDYWDAIGLFPTRNQIFHYPSPGDRTNSDMLGFVESSHPNVILRTSKMELLEPFFMVWLKPRYARVNSEIYVRYSLLPATPECHYSGDEVGQLAAKENFRLPIALLKKSTTDLEWARVQFRNLNNENRPTLTAEELPNLKLILAECAKTGTQYAIAEAGPWEGLPVPAFSQFFGYDGRL